MFIYKSDRAVVAWVFQLFLQGSLKNNPIFELCSFLS